MQAGKDRTGIIAALVLACSGASDVQIVEDYARCCQHTLLAAVLTFSPSRLIEVGKGRGDSGYVNWLSGCKSIKAPQLVAANNCVVSRVCEAGGVKQ